VGVFVGVFVGVLVEVLVGVIVGVLVGVATSKSADAVLPVPPLVEETGPETLCCGPKAIPTTFAATVHDPLGAIVPPDKLIVPPPATAVAVPPQVLLKPLGEATVSPGGSGSEKETPSAATVVFGFVMVKVKVEVPLSGIVVGLNALLIDGGATTVRLALDVLPVPPFVEVTVTELLLTPAVVPVTLTVIVHVMPNVAPDRLTVDEPAVAVVVPPEQKPLWVRPLGVATTSPAGSVSVKATPVSGMPLEFAREKVRVVVPLSGIVRTPKALLMKGGDACA